MPDIRLRDSDNDQLKLGDSVEFILGDGVDAADGSAGDVTLRWDGTDLDLLPTVDDSIFKIGDGTLSFDLWLMGGSASAYVSWDASANDLKLEDSVSLMFGTGAGAGPGNAGDVEIRWDATDLDVLAAADDSVIKFGNGTNSFDVWIYGNTASDYVLFDASANELSLQGAVTLDVPAGQLQIGNTAVSATAAELNRGTDVSTRSIAAGATLAVTEATHESRTILLDQAAGSVCTLPAPVVGARFRFLVTVKPTSNFHQIKVAAATDFMGGVANILDADAAAQAAYWANSASSDNIQLNGTTTGGQIGDWIEIEGITSTVWAVTAQLNCPAGSNPATPFSAAV